jgi:hypothetical protein
VVLAASLRSSHEEGRPATSKLLCPLSLFTSNAIWGLAEWPTNAGSETIIRRQLNHPVYPNLASQAARAFGKIPPDDRGTCWMNYYGPPGTVPAVGYHRALESNSLPRDYFAGKAVFVGQAGWITSSGQNGDFHATPFTRWRGGQSTGVELHATAFLNLVNREWLHELSPLTELALLLAFGAVFGFGLPKIRPVTGGVLAIVSAVLIGAAAVSVAWVWHRWFPWLIICAIQIPCALAWSILLHLRRLTEEKAILERDLALAESVSNLPAALHSDEVPDATTRLSEHSQPGPCRDEQPPPIPNHRLIRMIGRGSYGEVWLAEDEIGSYHAVKVVYQRAFHIAAPYERELRGLQKFTPISRRHHGLVHVLHVGRNNPEGYFFCIMELGDDKSSGQQIVPATYSPHTLASELESGKLPLPRCIQLGLELTSALQFLHDQQLVHRDIKPSNIVFVNRSPKLADIGLVTEAAAEGKERTFVGTEGYIAPEGPGTVAADIYSLGKVLYEACTGRDRREFPSLSGTLVVSGGQELAVFNDLVLKACHPEVKHRYQSASQLRADLLKLQQPSPGISAA